MIPFNLAVEKIKKGDVLINDTKNVLLLNNLLDKAFNKENNVLGYGKCYYREITYTFDDWVSSCIIPNNRNSFKLSEVLIKDCKNSILKRIKKLINNI